MSMGKKTILIISLILIADQSLKIWVKTSMYLGESIPVIGNWFIIRFVENDGMAYGIDIPGKFGKMALSLFRIIAVGAIGYYLHILIKKKARNGLIICLSFIFAGAMGNILDSMFYGLIFNESSLTQTAEFLPANGGYNSFLHGDVVDMFYFPILEYTYPKWFPLWGGQTSTFFNAIFNLADSFITIGIISILLFNREILRKSIEA